MTTPKLTAAQVEVLRELAKPWCSANMSSATSAWWYVGEKQMRKQRTPQIKSLLAKGFLKKESWAFGSLVAKITEAGRAYLAALDAQEPKQ